jgi:serine/threonine protein kinase
MAEGTKVVEPKEPQEDVDWRGTARYEVVRLIARGGMGSVYEAYDHERRRHVALKTLRRVSPNSLFLFKQEFRTLVDIRHPNLVSLYELVATEGERLFFAMELVRGTDLVTYVRPMRIGRWRDSRNDETRSLSAPPTVSRASRVQRRPSHPPNAVAPPRQVYVPLVDFGRLRAVLRQLVEGVQALHRAGKLHRDLKPSNVLITHEGRVVILDLGIAADLRSSDESLHDGKELIGTPIYMAPEQCLSLGPSQDTFSSDWYSVGVMLYEALVGNPPIDLTEAEVIRLKTKVDPKPPSDQVPSIPPDLDMLCLTLLDRDPARRPTGPEILRRLDAAPNSRNPPTPFGRAATASPPPRREAHIVGRDAQLLALRNAFEATRAGSCVTVHVSGRAGMGKSTLIEHFLTGLAERGEGVVLRGRAYERESVPYKAVDAVIDALSRQLMHQSHNDQRSPLPANMAALARLFPVLRRVPSLEELPDEPVADPQSIRHAAFRALRELLASVASRRPHVISIDDVQWGDRDSAALILELVRPPLAPPLLLLLTQREEDAQAAPFLTELEKRWPRGAQSHRLLVGPLESDVAHRLAVELLSSSGAATEELAESVAREAAGSPFLIEELTRTSIRPLMGGGEFEVTLEGVIGARLQQLPDEARRLVEIVALAGRPLPVALLAEAACIEAIDEPIEVLVARRFVRSGLRDGREVVEPVHDRIRETIVGWLTDPVASQHHGRLAQALETMAEADPEALAMHWLAAGDQQRAARFADAAGQQAAAKLAFDQAARLFRMALENASLSPNSSDLLRMRVKLAEALQFAGRHDESATAYIAAAEAAPAERLVEIQRAAAEELLWAGRVNEGAEMLRAVLRAVGMRAPRSPVAAVFRLLVYRSWLALIGIRVKERKLAELKREDRNRIEALRAVAVGFSIVDVILGACMQTRYLIEALRKGDQLLVLRAASVQAAHIAASGKPETSFERALVELAGGIAAREASPEASMVFAGTRGIALWNRGRWKEARELLERAVSVPFHGISGFSSIRLFDAYVHYFLGAFRECDRRLGRLMAEALDRNDLYTLVNLRSAAGTWLALVHDEPERARREMRDALSQWLSKSFSLQHWNEMIWGAEIELYAGDGAGAYEHIRQRQSGLNRSFLLRAGFIRVSTRYMRGRAAIASIGSLPGLRRARAAEARRLARRLAGEHDTWAAALASLLLAMANNAAGKREAAIATLREGIDRAQATDTMVYALPARYRLGELLGGDQGRALIREAVAAMTAEGVKDPERWVACQLPGDWQSRS